MKAPRLEDRLDLLLAQTLLASLVSSLGKVDRRQKTRRGVDLRDVFLRVVALGVRGFRGVVALGVRSLRALSGVVRFGVGGLGSVVRLGVRGFRFGGFLRLSRGRERHQPQQEEAVNHGGPP